MSLHFSHNSFALSMNKDLLSDLLFYIKTSTLKSRLFISVDFSLLPTVRLLIKFFLIVKFINTYFLFDINLIFDLIKVMLLLKFE
jgi:hypothetical protein